MRVSRWTGRQILLLWLIGIAGQVALTVLPTMALYAYMRREVPRLSHELALADSRWQAAEHSDSLLVAAQRRNAIRNGAFTVTATGDTVTAVVRMPSGRPAEVNAAMPAHLPTIFFIRLAIQHGAIPVVLILITAYWIGTRGRRDEVPPGVV